MNREIQTIRESFIQVLQGEPWYGRSVYEIMSEVKEEDVYHKPNGHVHSLVELLYHMITWADFTLACLQQRRTDQAEVDRLDWRAIDPAVHKWKIGLEQLKSVHQQILDQLDQMEDAILDKIVDEKKFSYRTVIHGLIHHDIYHLGQIVILKNLQ